jgi:hypothetical protein
MRFFMSGTPRNDKYQDQEDTLCSSRLFSLHGDYMRPVMKWLQRVVDNPNRPYPKIMMLDSGAFTAWNAGEEATLDHVIESYERFEDVAGDLFEEIWMINLDKIPGEKGRDPTQAELDESIVISDRNYKILVEKFGDRILPVFHQDESDERLFEIADMADYFCISPRNDLPEARRKRWSQRVHHMLTNKYGPGAKRTHGLATTGNEMIREVPWYSIDSAAWILHAGYGKIDVFLDDRFGGLLGHDKPRYRNWFVSEEGGKSRYAGQHIDTILPATKALLVERMNQYGFDEEQVRTDSRARSLVCMGELEAYAQWAFGKLGERLNEADAQKRISTQQTLLGD